jgi:hypothetical protein
MTVIPEIVQGHVIVLKVLGTSIVYHKYAIGKYCNLYGRSGKFNPALYDLLETESYDCIVDTLSYVPSYERKISEVDEAFRRYPHLMYRLEIEIRENRQRIMRNIEEEMRINKSYLDILETLV